MPAVKYFSNELPVDAALSLCLPHGRNAGISYLFFFPQNKLLTLHQYYYHCFLFKHACDDILEWVCKFRGNGGL
jgi:hypothetical protein